MHFLRRVALIFSSLLLRLTLISLALTFAVLSAFGSPDTIKQTLNQSGIYDQAVESTLNSIEQTNSKGQQQLPLDRPEVREAAKTAFPPATIKGWSENFIDGFYAWLEGKTHEPEFKIDLAEAKQTFVQKMADHVENRLKGLPPCSVQESFELSRQKIDPLTIRCRPPIDIAAEKQRFIDNLNQNDNFLSGDTTFTAADLNNQGNQPLNADTSPAPQWFQLLKKLPLLLTFASLLLMAAVIFAADEKKQGIKKVAMTILGVGIFLLVGSFLINYLFGSMNRPEGALGKAINIPDNSLELAVLALIRSLFGAFSKGLIIISAIYAAVGGGGLLLLHFTGHDEPHHPEPPEPSPAAEGPLQSEEPKTPETDLTETKPPVMNTSQKDT